LIKFKVCPAQNDRPSVPQLQRATENPDKPISTTHTKAYAVARAVREVVEPERDSAVAVVPAPAAAADNAIIVTT